MQPRVPFYNIRHQAYELAYKLAWEKLASMDIKHQCPKSGAQYQEVDAKRTIIIEYLIRPYLISLPQAAISLRDSEESVPLKEKILILHYLTSAKGTPATNKLITFKQLSGCTSYFPVFYQLAIKPLLDHFGKQPELLMASAAKLGGYSADYGDTSMTIRAFPRVPITIALWRGDDEFAPRGSIMFDSSISDYLSAEDIRELCATITSRLISFKKCELFPVISDQGTS